MIDPAQIPGRKPQGLSSESSVPIRKSEVGSSLKQGLFGQPMIDLHTHSSASDGTLAPETLLAAAARRGLRAVALTDHDTMAGVPEFLAAGAGSDTIPVPGVEVACSWYGGSLHLLGLFVDHQNSELQALLGEIREARERRNQKILRRLAEQGVALSPASLRAESQAGDGGVIGRPHFARALIRFRHCTDRNQAFAQYLGRQGSAYVRRFLPLPKIAVETIHRAGGVAILAHPFGGGGRVAPAAVRQKLQKLAGLGLDGVEAYYCDANPGQERQVLQWVEEFSLVASGGSDFHGDNAPGIELGRGAGRLAVPDALLDDLRGRAEGWRKPAVPLRA